MSSGKFHHGNLRSALIEFATDALRTSGHESLSLRDLATSVGVSNAAPYRHFASKDDLLQAVAANGLHALTESYREAEAMDAPPYVRLRAACAAYLGLAQSNPGLFNLLFFTEAYVDRLGSGGGNAGSAFTIFESLVGQALGKSDAEHVRMTAIAAWSLIHGFAILLAQNRISRLAPAELTQAAMLDVICNRLIMPADQLSAGA